jgi:hypothetical protein
MGSLDDMKKKMDQVSSQVQKAAKKSSSKILKSQAQEMKMDDNPEVDIKCKMVHMLVEEGLEMYESGDMSYEEMVDDLYEALKAV